MTDSTLSPSHEQLEPIAPWVALCGLRAPYGQCQCGCGLPAPTAKKTDRWALALEGQPLRYISGHNRHRGAATLADAFWRCVTPAAPAACWEWQGWKTQDGYGQFGFRQARYSAHRVSYELHYGVIPDGMCVCHACDNPPCVNPTHLWLGTDADNVRDMVQKGRQVAGRRAKLTRVAVAELRRLYAAGGFTQKALAQQFGVTQAAISFVISGRTWKKPE